MSTVTNRTVRYMAKSVPTIEGAGVRLKRAFGNLQGVNLDPFLLLDEMHSDDPKDTAPGFPWHPHRGIETFTVMIEGNMAHGDSLGNTGLLKPGDLQYMTGGSGIIHQEMPKPEDTGTLRGLQLWVNLPRSHKMMKPRYQEIKSSTVKSVNKENKIDIRVLAGEFEGVTGPVDDIPTYPRILDITMEHECVFNDQTPKDHTMVAYVLDGEGYFEENDRLLARPGHLVVLNNGAKFVARSKNESFRFMVFSGKPIREPVAWAGPVVMNTEEELRKAFQEIQEGKFIKHEYKI